MIKIEIERETGMVYLDKTLLGRDKENLQEMLYFTFRDGIFNGTGRLEYKLPNGESHFVLLETNGIDYYLPIKNVLLENGHIEMQFVLTESETEEGIPVFKSNIFTLYCKESINAVEEQPSDYELWIETANAKLAEIDDAIEQTSNLDIDIEKVGHTTTITLTDKEGNTKSVNVNDGIEKEIIGGTNISVEEDENTIKINNTYDDTTILNNIETLTNAISEHDTDIQNIENNIDTIEKDIDNIGTEIDNLDLNKQDTLIAGSNITIEDNVISATGGGGQSTFIYNIGSYQYTYDSYVLPAILKVDLDLIYQNEKTGTPQILKWALYGNESYFKVVSSDEIAGKKSIDILVHNKYHCSYEWETTSSGTINPIVQTQQEVPSFTNSSLGTIKGSTTDGNVSANSDGTGSVSGWTQLQNRTTILEGSLSSKQNATDTQLDTTDKTIVGGINEVNSIAKQSNKAKGYTNYQSLITELNSASKTDYNVGQSFLIQTLNVPDLWVISIESTSQQYTYTTDEAFITATGQSSGVQVGYYRLCQLETLKQDLTNYVKNTDFATSSKAGIIKANDLYAFDVSNTNGDARVKVKTYQEYGSLDSRAFICKGTLENVIVGKDLTTKSYVDGLVGNIETQLSDI